jgi:hypothetical protein
MPQPGLAESEMHITINATESLIKGVTVCDILF